MIVCEILKIGKQGRVIEVTSSPHLQRGKHLVYQRSHRKRHPKLTSSFQDKTEVLVVKADATPRSKIMGKHTRSTKFHHPVGGKTAPKHLQDLCRVNSCLRPKHQCFAHRLNGQCNNNLIAGFDYLARSILPDMHNRFTQRLKDGQATFEGALVASHHNRKRASDSPLIAPTHRSI